MSYCVKIHPQAPAEIEQAYLWLVERAPQAAVAWFNDLLSRIDTLQQFPARCPLAPENTFFEDEIHQLVVGHYRVIFTIKKKTVHILHVRHTARGRMEL